MVTFSEAVQRSGRLALCALFATNEAVNALISPIAGDSLGLYPLTRGLRRQLCSDDPDNDPVYEPPFEGGQCPDVVYRPFVTTVNPSTGAVIGEFDRPPGVGPWRIVPTGSNPCADPCTFPGDTCFDQALQSGDGSTTTTLAAGCAQFRSWQSIRFEVVSGTEPPGGCGDPPPPLGPPGPVEFGDDITYNIDDSTDITVPINFVFAPIYAALDGTLNVPVTFDVGGLEFTGEVTVAPEFNFEFKPTLSPTPTPKPDNPDDLEDEDGEPQPPTPEPEEGSAIVGVIVRSSIVGEQKSTAIATTGMPTIYAPRVASVKFAINAGAVTAWTSDLDVKNLDCYVPCPAPQGAAAVSVTPMPGFSCSFTPVRGKPLTDFG